MSYTLLSKRRGELMGVAIFAVMLFHLNDVDFGLSALNGARSLGFGGVDAFIMLSAMSLSMSLIKREREYGDFMRRRARRILPAYYCVMIPYTLCLIYVSRATWGTLVWNASLLYYWVRPKGAFNWYVAAIMTFYAVTPMCVRALKRAKLREIFTLFAVVLGTALGFLVISENDYRYNDLIYRIPIYFVGLLVGQYAAEGRRFKLADWAIWGAVAAAGAAFLPLYEKAGFYIPLCYLFLFTTVPMCLILAWLFDKLPQIGFFRLLGECSLEIYLLNVSFFSERDFLRRFIDFDAGHYAYAAITVTANIAIGVAFHKILERIKSPALQKD